MDVFDEMEADSAVDATSLDTELGRVAYLHAKWLRRYTEFSRLARDAQRTLARVKLDRQRYWMGEASDEVYKQHPLNRRVLKTEVADYLKADPEVQKAEEEAEILNGVALAVEKFVSSINSRGYNLGKMVDYLRWKNGG